MKKYGLRFLLFPLLSLTFVIGMTVYADGPNLTEQVGGQLNAGAESSGLKIKDQDAPDVRVFGATLINMLLGAYGTIFVILMVHAGHLLVTAHGNQEQIEKAYKTIIGAIVGLVLILSAYSIGYFAVKASQKATRFGTEPVNINYE